MEPIVDQYAVLLYMCMAAILFNGAEPFEQILVSVKKTFKNSQFHTCI